MKERFYGSIAHGDHYFKILGCPCNSLVIERLFNLYKDEQNKHKKGLILKSLFNAKIIYL